MNNILHAGHLLEEILFALALGYEEEQIAASHELSPEEVSAIRQQHAQEISSLQNDRKKGVQQHEGN